MSEKRTSDDSETSGAGKPISRAEFAALYSDAYKRLWLLAAGLLADRNAAEDVVQEAAIVALEKLNQYERGTNFSAWLAKIVRLKAYNIVRKKNRRATTSSDPAIMDRSHAANVESVATVSETNNENNRPPIGLAPLPEEQQWFDDAVMQALTALGETERACMLLRSIDQLTYEEIALLLDIPEGTAASHVHRAKKTMRKSLSVSYTSARKPDTKL